MIPVASPPARARVALAACGLAAACGGHPRTASSPPDPCETGDLGACLGRAARSCRPGQAWRVALRDLPALTVAASGALRLDQAGGELYSIDATHFAACFADCPGGGGERICFPLELPVRLDWRREPGCAVDTAAGPPFGGLPTTLGRERCSNATLAVVADLAPVQRALVRAGVIEPDSALATAPGLVVAAGPDGAPAIAIDAALPAGCDRLALPAGYRLALGEADVAALAAIAEAPARAAEAGSRAILAAGNPGALERARTEVLDWVLAHHADQCRQRGLDPADRAALERCAAAMPETEPRYAAAVARATQAERRRHRAELDAVTAAALIGPVCRAFAARRPM